VIIRREKFHVLFWGERHAVRDERDQLVVDMNKKDEPVICKRPVDLGSYKLFFLDERQGIH
jgi:hypothetical protein